jgi:hypothetical protein
MVCTPLLSAVVLYVALPLLRLALPSVFPPSLNVTVPVAAEGVMLAVNVTELPGIDGLPDEEMLRDVLAGLTVCVTADDVLPLRFESPL